MSKEIILVADTSTANKLIEKILSFTDDSEVGVNFNTENCTLELDLTKMIRFAALDTSALAKPVQEEVTETVEPVMEELAEVAEPEEATEEPKISPENKTSDKKEESKPKKNKTSSPSNKKMKDCVIDIQALRDAIDFLGMGGTDNNIKKACQISGLGSSTLWRYYGMKVDTIAVWSSTYDSMMKIFKHVAKMKESIEREKENLSKNEIMVRRVMRAKNTTDAVTIAKVIMGSREMMKQTAFKGMNDIVSFVQGMDLKKG